MLSDVSSPLSERFSLVPGSRTTIAPLAAEQKRAFGGGDLTEKDISIVGVVGAGLMGHGLALEFARAGYSVILQDESAAQRDSAPDRIRAAISTLTRFDLVDASAAGRILEHISIIADLDELAGKARFIVEAVVEDLAVKQSVFARLDANCAPGVVLASNTSAFSPTDIGNATENPQRVLVTHYFNPPYLLPGVEIVPGRETAPESVETAVRLCRSIAKEPVVLRRETTGFVINRLQFALFREAVALVEDGIVSPQDLDRLVVTGMGNRLGVYGPFKIADLAGLDVYESICRSVFPVLNNSDGPQDSLSEMVDSGRFGAKTRRGVYEWSDDDVAEVIEGLARHAAMMFRDPSDG